MVPKLKIKDSLCILKDSKDNYVFISTATRRVKKFQVDSLVKEVISSLESAVLELDLINKLSSKYRTQDIELCLRALEKEGIVRRYEKDHQLVRFGL